MQATRLALDKEAAIEGARIAAGEEDTTWPATLFQSAGQGPDVSEHEPPAATGAVRAAPLDVLDAAALGRLRELDPEGRTGLVVRVLRAFDGSARRLGAQLEEARAKGDLSGIKHVVHTLKSSSASIGALGLSNLCIEIETLIRNDSTQPLDLPLDRMTNELETVLKALSPLLGPTT